jgi:hypothetical protein
MGNIFLSHDHDDQEIASEIANTIGRITLGQIKVWFSSDNSPYGGMKPGVWFDQLRERLSHSEVILVLLTPRSIDKKWLYFESGFGASHPDCEVIPLAVGMKDFREIPFPLALYQAYLLVDFTSYKNFVQKLLTKFDITFDEEMTSSILSTSIGKITSLIPSQESKPAESIPDIIQEIKDHIDKRLLYRTNFGAQENSELVSTYLYEIQLDVNKEDLTATHELGIYEGYTVQDILNNIYFLLDDLVPPYTYLTKWVIREEKDGLDLVIKNYQDKVPAKEIFTKGSRWRVRFLDKPYNIEKPWK